MIEAKQEKTYQFHAFISYSRKDKVFAEQLEKALEGYKPPKDLDLSQHNLNVFRDESDMTGAEHFRSIEGHLANSAKMLLVCSPYARKSELVNDEIRRFAKINGVENIIPILLSGIPNNKVKPGQEDEMAFPEALCEIMEMPLATSYLGFRIRKDKVNKGIFEGAWYTILSNVYTISRDDIEQRDKKRQVRRRRIIAAVVSSVTFMLITLAAVALWQRDKAKQELYQANYNDAKVYEEKAGIALANAEADRSEQEYQKAWLYTLAAVDQDIGPNKRLPISLGRLLLPELRKGAFPVAWHSPIQRQDWIPETAEYVRRIESVVFSPDGRCLAAAYLDRTIRMWDVGSGDEVMTLSGHQFTYQTWNPFMKLSDDDISKLINKTVSRFIRVTFSPDGKWLASGSSDRNIRLWDVESLEELAVLTGHAGSVRSVAFSPDGRWLVSKTGGSIRLWNIAHLKYYEFGSESLEKIRQASLFLLPYRHEGSDLVPKRSKPRFLPVNCYQFPNARFQKLLRPRPPNTDPAEWMLENME